MSDESMNQQERPRLVTVRDFAKYYDWPTSASALRWWIFTSKMGFGRCVRRIGRRVLIDRVEFEKWLESVSESAVKG